MRDLAGVNVVVTGAIGGESRQTASAKLRDAGALVQASVGRSTELLVTGGKVGRTKIDAAKKNGVEVVPWEDLWAVSSDKLEGERGDGILATPATVGHPAYGPRARQIGPMLCKAGELPVGPEWLYEVKWDGYRCIARVQDGEVSMVSRSGKTDYVGQFPQIAELLNGWPDVVLDGELVVLDESGGSSLGSMGSKAGATLIVFDVLEMFGSDLRSLPLTDRRRVLEETLELVFANAGGGRIAVSPTFDDGQELLAYVIERNLEGVIAKKRSGVYVEGARSWVKVKLRNAQEFVVLGWTPGNGALTGRVGGLLLGVRENGRWLYVGRAGSGPGDVERARLQELLEPLERDRHPEVDTGKAARAELKDVRWVEPALVVHVAFQRWSKDGRLVIPSLKGVRSDKAAVDVTREP